jgi:hypothetical protein
VVVRRAQSSEYNSVRALIGTGANETYEGLTLRQAALVAGFAYLLNPVTYAEYVYPKLVIPGNIEQTAQNISTHGGLSLAAMFC